MATVTNISKDTANISNVIKSSASSISDQAKNRILGQFTMAELALFTLAELAAYTFLSIVTPFRNQQKS